MKTTRTLGRMRGISLIEAVVALAVMAFGMVALVGLQATLRGNADQSRQRAEAVRIAQEAVEQRRTYSVMTAASGPDFTGITSQPAINVAGTNATFALTETVVDVADPAQKTLVVTVDWLDRANQPQQVRIASRIAGVAPELVGGLATPDSGSLAQQPAGRHPAIPPGAITQSGGTSVFTPPGASSGVSWTFNNATGVITQICSSAGVCTAVDALPVSGFVRFATGAAPTPADAEVPTGAAFPVTVEVELTSPSVTTVSCYTQLFTTAVAYYCAVPTGAPGAGWSGRTLLGGLLLSPTLADPTIGNHKVCRYTPVAGCDPAVGDVVWGRPGAALSCSVPSPQTIPPTPSRRMLNADHPLDHDAVSVPLTSQDFLVISAGDGSNAFACPADDTSTPLVNGTTRPHQPLT